MWRMYCGGGCTGGRLYRGAVEKVRTGRQCFPIKGPRVDTSCDGRLVVLLDTRGPGQPGCVSEVAQEGRNAHWHWRRARRTAACPCRPAAHSLRKMEDRINELQSVLLVVSACSAHLANRRLLSRPVRRVYAQAPASVRLRCSTRQYYVRPVRSYAFGRVPSTGRDCTMPKPSRQQAANGRHPDA